MAIGRQIAGSIVIIAACGLMIAHSQVGLGRSEFLIASNAKIWAAEAKLSKPEEVKMTREQYLDTSLAAERECRQLYAEQSFALLGYSSEQSCIMLAGGACLFVTGFGLSVSSWRHSLRPAQKAAEPR